MYFELHEDKFREKSKNKQTKKPLKSRYWSVLVFVCFKETGQLMLFMGQCWRYQKLILEKLHLAILQHRSKRKVNLNVDVGDYFTVSLSTVYCMNIKCYEGIMIWIWRYQCSVFSSNQSSFWILKIWLSSIIFLALNCWHYLIFLKIAS